MHLQLTKAFSDRGQAACWGKQLSKGTEQGNIHMHIVESHQEAVEAEEHAEEQQALELVRHVHQGIVPVPHGTEASDARTAPCPFAWMKSRVDAACGAS